jgi:hypothetical protein
MIDKPWRLLPAAGYGKFKPVRDVEFAAVAAVFCDFKRFRKPMNRMGLLFKPVPGGDTARAAPAAESLPFALRSRSSHLETMP